MAEKQADSKRYWIRMSPETKRRLDHLAVEADAESTEAYAGGLLTAEVDKLWAKFDPKSPRKPK